MNLLINFTTALSSSKIFECYYKLLSIKKDCRTWQSIIDQTSAKHRYQILKFKHSCHLIKALSMCWWSLQDLKSAKCLFAIIEWEIRLFSSLNEECTELINIDKQLLNDIVKVSISEMTLKDQKERKKMKEKVFLL